jgi:hypothetical protein
MSREYTAYMNNVTVTSTNTLVALAPGTNSPAYEILRGWVSQRYGATSGQQGVNLVTQFNGAAANQVVGTGVTPAKTKGTNDPLSILISSTVAGPGGVATVNCTSDGNGAKTTIYPDNFNVLNGWLWVPTPTETHMISGYSSTQSYGLYFPVTPVTLTNWTAGLSYRELG